MAKESKKAQAKVKKVMEEFGRGGGSKNGPLVTSRKQVIAIGMPEIRKKGMKVPKK